MLSFRVQFSRSLMVIGRRVRVKLFPIYDVAVKFSLGNYFSSNNGGLRFTCQILSKTILKGWHTYTILYILILKFVKFSDFPFKYDERLLLRAERGIWLWIINFFPHISEYTLFRNKRALPSMKCLLGNLHKIKNKTALGFLYIDRIFKFSRVLLEHFVEPQSSYFWRVNTT